MMPTSLSPEQQADTVEQSLRFFAGLHKLADVGEAMVHEEGCSSMELAGYIVGCVGEISRFVPWAVQP